MASTGHQPADAEIQVEGRETLEQPVIMPLMEENLAALPGGNNNARRERGRRQNEEIMVAQRKQSNSMLARALKIVLAITGYFATDTGKELLQSALASEDDDFAATPIYIFVLTMVAYVWLSLISRIFRFRSTMLEDCSAFLMAMMVVSLVAVFVHDRVPWLILVPLLFPVLVVVRKVWMLCF